MDKVSNIVIKSLEQSKYIKPLTMHFTQNGTNRTWDILSVHDSVAIVIYNITRNVLVLVKQFRPAVYFGCLAEEDRKVGATVDTQKYPPEIGITLELCAGIVDKAIAEIEIAKEEILEECGYDVPVTNLVKIGSYRSGVGTSGSKQVCYYCEVTDEMKVSSGGEQHGREDQLEVKFKWKYSCILQNYSSCQQQYVKRNSLKRSGETTNSHISTNKKFKTVKVSCSILGREQLDEE
ncbi:unnamed protein product [Acanthoscelides obtectus]|uniref:Uridine diphosphate glucose pyrophosphatase NUDT14 n=1 Tax=Acanthoscelides obtectus TaxID=200917 RepID=A0A9P0JP29_ACAOB|nr:unnamed protein product [Acanthoscelides obtectus]CAK1673735.1 Uridine diphosphate glucose pyrophosphatase [Acanthoscelides obtectus]